MKYLICFIITWTLLCCGGSNKDKVSSVLQSSTEAVDVKEYSMNADTCIQPDTNRIILSEFIIVNDDFKYILDTCLEGYEKCDRAEKDYHFTITINNVMIKDSLGKKNVHLAKDSLIMEGVIEAKSLYISRSYYLDFVSRGYGFFYHKNYLFVIEGLRVDRIFEEVNLKQSFPYKDEPVTIFDPSRWLYYYIDEKFYMTDNFPCG